MRVETYNLRVAFSDGVEKCFYGISRAAVKRYIEWYREYPDFVGFRYEARELKRNHTVVYLFYRLGVRHDDAPRNPLFGLTSVFRSSNIHT